jgi:hypothetical protein
MRWMLSLVTVLVAGSSLGSAQIQSRPTDPPLVTAANESWFVLREPIQFAGDLYYPDGAAVFFDGNTMVRAGHYNGVPLYVDTTVEPFSVVLVPGTRGLLQPYVRDRRDDGAGTPGFPRSSFQGPEFATPLMAPVAPTALPLSPGAISVYTPESIGPVAASEPVVAIIDSGRPLTNVMGTAGDGGVISGQAAQPVVTMRGPEGNEGVWIMFGGEKWISAGAAVPISAADFVLVGEYAGFPVFARRELNEDVIYLPSRAGLIAPYRLRE